MKFQVRFLGELETPKRHFEIKRPLETTSLAKQIRKKNGMSINAFFVFFLEKANITKKRCKRDEQTNENCIGTL